MTTTTSIESVILSNPKIATHPKLEAYCDEYLAALESGLAPDPALLTEMFAVLAGVSSTDPTLATALSNLKTEVVEQVVIRDEALAANAQLGSMLAYYSGQLAGGYAADETTTTAIVGALEGVTTSDPILQDLLDTVTDVLAPPMLPSTFGVRLPGLATSDLNGEAVAPAGDINGDGIDDIMISSRGPTRAGETYIIFGVEGGLPADAGFGSLDGTNGFVAMGVDEGDRSGMDLASAGDVNGDGIDDILIGAWLAGVGDVLSVGETYVLFGSREGFDPVVDLAALDGFNGFTIRGAGAFDRTGFSVSSAGDVNGDGRDDILIGAPYADSHRGESYVVFGSVGGFPAVLDLGTLDGTNGFLLKTSLTDTDFQGYSVSSVGDMNADGIDDIAVAPMWRGGDAYVVFGRTSGFGAIMDLAAIDGTNGFVLTGGDERQVSSAGDINGDGISDLLIGAYLTSDYTGEAYVVFGSDQGFAPTLDLTGLDGTNGFAMTGRGDFSALGISVSSGGDVNGDGITDILVGADGASEVYLMFGSNQGFAASTSPHTFDGTDGFVFRSDTVNGTGFAVSSAGDINADGFDDLLIGALLGAGETYVVYGGDDILDRFDLSDGTRDGVIQLANLGLNPADYDILA